MNISIKLIDGYFNKLIDEYFNKLIDEYFNKLIDEYFNKKYSKLCVDRLFDSFLNLKFLNSSLS